MIISPSLLSADFSRLGDELDMLSQSEARWLHLDIMDGVFVPNISFGFPVIEAVARNTKLTLDAHLMTVHPEFYTQRLADLGVSVMTVHAEVCTHLHRVLTQIREAGMKAGVALNPHTPLAAIEEILTEVDVVLLMSVNPGFGGQTFIENTLDKTRRLQNLLTERDSGALVEIDGGVNRRTARLLEEAGADILVAGSAVFGAEDPVREIEILRGESARTKTYTCSRFPRQST